MRSRRPHPEQQEAISRRLALLSAELAAARPPVIAADQADHIYDQPNPRQDVVPPLPGRHAARRPMVLPRPRAVLPPRFDYFLGPGTFAVVAVLVAVGLVVTAWWAIHSRPQEVSVTPVVAAPAMNSSPLVDLAPEAPSQPDADVVVDVSGKVRRPGIAVLSPGARVVDALAAAGGARRGVDLGTLNLARPVVDGEQILVGLRQPSGLSAAAAAPPLGNAPARGELVNLNTADQTLLETLPGVGPVTAQAILTWRSEHDGFGAVEELLDVQGIGEATLAQLAPHVTV